MSLYKLTYKILRYVLNKWFLSIDFHPFFLLLAFPNFCKEFFITSNSDKLEKKVYAIDWNQSYLYLSLGCFTLQSILIIFSFFFFNWCFNLLFKYFPPLGALIFLHLCVSFEVGACFTFFLRKISLYKMTSFLKSKWLAQSGTT